MPPPVFLHGGRVFFLSGISLPLYLAEERRCFSSDVASIIERVDGDNKAGNNRAVFENVGLGKRFFLIRRTDGEVITSYGCEMFSYPLGTWAEQDFTWYFFSRNVSVTSIHCAAFNKSTRMHFSCDRGELRFFLSSSGIFVR